MDCSWHTPPLTSHHTCMFIALRKQRFKNREIEDEKLVQDIVDFAHTVAKLAGSSGSLAQTDVDYALGFFSNLKVQHIRKSLSPVEVALNTPLNEAYLSILMLHSTNPKTA